MNRSDLMIYNIPVGLDDIVFDLLNIKSKSFEEACQSYSHLYIRVWNDGYHWHFEGWNPTYHWNDYRVSVQRSHWSTYRLVDFKEFLIEHGWSKEDYDILINGSKMGLL